MRLILALCCTSTFLVQMDNTIVNVALPDIQTQLDASLSALQWVVASYLLTLAAFLIFSGSLGDRFGRRRIFLTGLTVFGLGSLLSGMAQSQDWLIAFRVLQALGASMLNPSGMSLIGNIFKEPLARAKAFAVWGFVVGIGMACGPLFGGPLVQIFGWRSVFLINVPIVIVTVILVRQFVPESKAEEPRAFDPIGQILMLAFLFSLVFTIIEFSSGNTSTEILVVTILMAVCSVSGLVFYESRRREPLIDLRFFKSIPFSFASLIAVANYSSIGGFLFLNTFFLQSVLGYSPLKAGLFTVPMAVMTAVGAQVSGRLTATSGVLRPLFLSGFALVIAALLTIYLASNYSLYLLFISYVLFGFAFGAANTPVNIIAMAGMPRSRAGVAGAIASTSRQVGQMLGVALTGALLVRSLHEDIVHEYARASLPSWLVLVISGFLIVSLGVLATTKTAQRSVAAVTALISE